MGAWIEINTLTIKLASFMSHSIWVRGLKYPGPMKDVGLYTVALYMGAWIEI